MVGEVSLAHSGVVAPLALEIASLVVLGCDLVVFTLVVLQAFDGVRLELAPLDIAGKMFGLHPDLTVVVVQVCPQNIGS